MFDFEIWIFGFDNRYGDRIEVRERMFRLVTKRVGSLFWYRIMKNPSLFDLRNGTMIEFPISPSGQQKRRTSLFLFFFRRHFLPILTRYSGYNDRASKLFSARRSVRRSRLTYYSDSSAARADSHQPMMTNPMIVTVRP